MRLFGLIGMPLTQSFSKNFFTEKFEREHISDAQYELFPLENISALEELLAERADLRGLNVTIPYKEQVLPFLHLLHDEVKNIGACNCIKIEDGQLTGFNTDAPAFKQSLQALLQPHHNKALILGTGGASKAVEYVLHQLEIEYILVSRKKGGGLVYEDLCKEIIEDYPLLINATPLGSFPKVDAAPSIPYQYISAKNYLYDLVYNPAKTLFLQKGEERGAIIKNGYEMLVRQAELSWHIWNEEQ